MRRFRLVEKNGAFFTIKEFLFMVKESFVKGDIYTVTERFYLFMLFFHSFYLPIYLFIFMVKKIFF